MGAVALLIQQICDTWVAEFSGAEACHPNRRSSAWIRTACAQRVQVDWDNAASYITGKRLIQFLFSVLGRAPVQ